MASTVPELASDSEEVFEKSPPGEPAGTTYAYELPEQPLISSTKFPPERLAEIARECAALSLPLRRMRIQIEDLKGIRDLDRLQPRPGMALAKVTL